MTLKALSDCGKEYRIERKDGLFMIRKDSIEKGLDHLDIMDESFFSASGNAGYYVICDCNGKGSAVCNFNEKSDGERVFKQNLMPVFGVKKADCCKLVIVEGYKYDFSLVFGVKKGNYYIYPRFHLYGLVPYDDIVLRYVDLPVDSEYDDMACAYRKYQLESGNCRKLSERIKESSALKYALEAPEIRIRMGWKPAPSKVLEQTVDTEPDMKVACTFERVCDLIDELKKQGIDKAQICLVGWNKSGHDGRYPQIFPVEEKLGGEQALLHLINHAKNNGYALICHTNSTDCYSVADSFSEDIIVKYQNGNLSFRPDIAWSGGRQYHLCPQKAYEFAKVDLERIKKLGFYGLHYIDVLSVVPLRWCFDKNHPLNSKETLEYYERIMALSHELFGGFSSEGVFDFTSKYLDYGLYVSWPHENDDFIDKYIPFFQIAYHGIILYNSTTDTVNYTIKSCDNHLKVIEDGSRPSFYFYSKFLEGSNQDDWLGKDDMVCDTDEQLSYSVSKIKEAYVEYKTLCNLQTEFIEKHREISKGIFETTYSNGTVVRTDYNSKTYSIE